MHVHRPFPSRFGLRGLHLADNPPPAGDPTPTPAAPADPPTGDAPAGTAPPAGDGTDPKLFTQADLNRIVKERIADEQRRAEKRIADEKKAADEQRMREQGEFKTIAEQKEAEVAELRPKAELADALAARVNSSIDAEVKAWPKEVVALDPGPENVTARLAWQEQARPLAQRLLAMGNGTTGLGAAGRTGAGGDKWARIREQAKADRAKNSGGDIPLEQRLGIAPAR